MSALLVKIIFQELLANCAPVDLVLQQFFPFFGYVDGRLDPVLNVICDNTLNSGCSIFLDDSL